MKHLFSYHPGQLVYLQLITPTSVKVAEYRITRLDSRAIWAVPMDIKDAAEVRIGTLWQTEFYFSKEEALQSLIVQLRSRRSELLSLAVKHHHMLCALKRELAETSTQKGL